MSEFLCHKESTPFSSITSCDSQIGDVLTYPRAKQLETQLNKISDHKWEKIVQQEKPLDNYPKYQKVSKLDTEGLPKFSHYKTISRQLFSNTPRIGNICPFGDESAPIVLLEEISQPKVIQDAYTLSALRFHFNPYHDTVSHPENKELGIPKKLQSLYRRISSTSQSDTFDFCQIKSLQSLEKEVKESQQKMRYRFVNELATEINEDNKRVPLMNANPLDPQLHERELSPEMVHDLSQYVQLQNSPHTFFDLMQGLEKEVAINHWHSLQIDPEFSIEDSMIYTMTSWRDRPRQGHRRKRPIKCPIGVPLGYMQAMRRKGQPCINQEFAGHAHGALNHWLQEHIWQRFCDRYPEKCVLHPSVFFKQIGHLHVAFADAIYELHMDNVVNPANTNFWTVLQYYLPLMSPWP